MKTKTAKTAAVEAVAAGGDKNDIRKDSENRMQGALCAPCI